jgi:hypothetical protein
LRPGRGRARGRASHDGRRASAASRRPHAYQLYLQGRFWNTRYTAQSFSGRRVITSKRSRRTAVALAHSALAQATPRWRSVGSKEAGSNVRGPP